MLLWRPIFIIALFVVVLWREFNCVKIPQGEANKSAKRWGNLRAKCGVVPPSVYTTEYTELQPLLSGVHSVMRVKLALAGEGGGCTPTPSYYIYHHQ
jgi:hypothetical protein